MPNTSLTVPNHLLSSTAMIRLDKIKSAIDKPYRWVDTMEKVGREEVEGGERVIVPWEFNRHSNTTRFVNGYEAIDLTLQPIMTPGHEDWMDVVRPVGISGNESRKNRGNKTKILSMVDRRTKSTVNGLRAQLQQQVWQSNVTELTDLVSANGTDDSTGFIEEVALAAQDNVIHNLARATYPHPGFQNQRYDGAGSFSANGLIGMHDIMVRVKDLVKGNDAHPSDSAVHIYASIALQGHLKRAVNSNERYLSQDKLDAGRMVMMYGEYPIISMSDLPNAGTQTTADPWSAVFFDHAAIQFYAQKGAYFEMTEFEKPSGYDVQVAYLHLMGQLIATYLGSSGVLYDAEAW